jgi:sarcosine oxidase, subunit gamma
MPDRPQHIPALAGRHAISGVHIQLEMLPEGHLLHVLGAIDSATLASQLAALGLSGGSVRAAGFQQWFVSGDEAVAPSRIAELAAALKPKAAVSDQSHGRVRISLSGAAAANLLSKGTAVDLDPNVFAEGQSAVTLFGHIPVQLVRTGFNQFELTVLRSFSESLWEELENLTLGYTA